MAASVTHIVIAVALLPLLCPLEEINERDKQEYIIGTIVPDIRCSIKSMPREKTHIEPITWHDVKNAQSWFHKGMLVHNVVDILRLRFFEPEFFTLASVDEGLYGNVNRDFFKRVYPLILKAAEDSILYEQLSEKEWHILIGYLDRLCEEEILLCSEKNKTKIVDWHQSIQNYIQQRPSSIEAFHYLLGATGGSRLKELPREVNAQLEFEKLLHNVDFVQRIKDFPEFCKQYVTIHPDEPLTTPDVALIQHSKNQAFDSNNK